jgi:hypothetical protein
MITIHHFKFIISPSLLVDIPILVNKKDEPPQGKPCGILSVALV